VKEREKGRGDMRHGSAKLLPCLNLEEDSWMDVFWT
jgi:hypothetical protein